MLSWGALLATRVMGGVRVTCVVASELICVFCWPSLVGALTLLLRLSLGCHRSWLVEHGAYELGLNMTGRQLV